MNNQQLTRLIQSLLRDKRRSPWVVGVVVLVVAYVLLQPVLEKQFGVSLPSITQNGSTATSQGEAAILSAFDRRQSNLIVQVSATVKKILPDDNIGHRHQKAILELPSGHTIKLAHNIDLADRVPFKVGEQIEVKGEYEYTELGGVIHWTHHDPKKRHEEGWIRHNGKQYE